MRELIDREVAIKNLERYKDLFTWDDGDRERAILTRVIKELQSMPSSQKTGKWIYSEGTGYGNPYGHYECSLCGDGYGYKTNFCPNCGCRMEEGDSDEKD